jgi:competence protein ComEA
VIPRSSRLALWCLALLLSLSLFCKGRVPAGKGEGAAFLRPPPHMIKVRLAGELPHPGLYLFTAGATVGGAIKMTMPELAVSATYMREAGRRLSSGDVVSLKLSRQKEAEFTVGSMSVKERMLLRIPLDPDLLEAPEWALLPGIGPVLSERIVADRHENGVFGSLQGVSRVKGIGPAKLEAMKPYF